MIGNLKTDQQKASHTEYEKPIIKDSEKDMALNKLNSSDKSRSSSRTETEDTVTPETKTGSISPASLYDKNIKEQQPKEIRIRKKIISDNRSVSSMSVHVGSTANISPDGERIPRKNKNKKLPEISITGNKITQEPGKQNKKAKVNSSIDEKKINVELTPPPNTNKKDYAGGTNDNTRDSQTHESEDSRIDTDGCARNIDEENKNEEDDDYIEPTSIKNK